MTGLADARQDLADALSEVTGYTVRARPFAAAPKPGDGWVTVARVVPSTFKAKLATLNVILILGAGEAKAEERLDADATALIDATAQAGLLTTDVALEPTALAVGDTNTPLFGATLAVTVEVTA